MLAYMALKPRYESEAHAEDKEEDTKEIKELKELAISHSLIERCVKVFRTRRSHRSVKDFDEKYLKDKSLWVVIDQMATHPKAECKN